MEKVLIVEDEFAISQVLKAYLTKVQFLTEQAYTGTEAMQKFHSWNPDLVLLDVMLPEKNGWQILEEIRQVSKCPVIMLTALGDVNYRLDGLNGGADDYIAKPFEAEEFLACLEMILRLQNPNIQTCLNFSDIELDLNSSELICKESRISLNPKELKLLKIFIQNPKQIIPKSSLL